MTEANASPDTSAANGAVFHDAPAVGVSHRDRNAMIEAAQAAIRAHEAKEEAAAAPAAKTPAPATSLADEGAKTDDAKAEPSKPAEPASLADETETAKAKPPASAEKAADEKPEPEKVEELPDPAANLRRILKLKEQQQTDRERADALIRAAEDEARTKAQKIIEEAKASAKSEVEALLRDLRANPIDTARRLGLDLEQTIAQQADDKDPVRELARKFEAALTERDKRAESLEGALKELLRRDDERTQLVARDARTRGEEEFIGVSKDPAFKYARERWSPPELLREAHAIIDDARAQAKRAGIPLVCPDKEVLALLNERAKEDIKSRATSLAELLREVGGDEVAKLFAASVKADEEPKAETPKATPGLAKTQTGGKAPQGQGQGTRTLSAQAASERRAPPTGKESELSEREFRELAQARVKEILRSSK